MATRREPPTTEGYHTVFAGTYKAARWLRYLRLTEPNSFMVYLLTHGKPITTRSEWPPEIEGYDD